MTNKKILLYSLILIFSVGTFAAFLFPDRLRLQAQPNTIQTATWATNGTVYDIEVSPDGSIVYLGGDFTYIGPITGGAVPIDVTTGEVGTYPQVTLDSQAVRKVIADGSGGWFVAGSFTEVDGQARSGLVHISSDGSLDTDFDVDFGTSPNNFDLLLNGTTLYVAGQFTEVDGNERDNLVALNATTGAVLSFAPDPNDIVRTMFLADDTLYVGGSFTSIGGNSRNYIAALDPTTGSSTAWNPNPDFGPVLDIAVSSSVVYAGGSFSSIGGNSRNYIAALDPTTGSSTAWNPSPNSSIYTLEVEGETVYVGGGFSTIGGNSRSYLAALDTTTGSSTAWNPSPDYNVYTIVIDGSDVYIGGDFTTVGTTDRGRLAVVDKEDGSVGTFNVATNSTVETLALVGDTLYVGGSFTSLGGVLRDYIGAIDGATGEATSFNPAADSSVYALELDGTTLYAGGSFSNIGGASRSKIAAVGTADGVATSWDPNADGFSSVRDIVVDGDVVYVGGGFTGIGGETRKYLAALDKSTGLATSWDADLDGGFSGVRTIVVSSSVVYVGGTFTSVGEDTRNQVAAIDKDTGLATSWDPNASGGFTGVTRLYLNGDVMYVGGDFTTIGGESRSQLAALDITTGSSTAWNPGPSGGNFGATISGIAVDNGVVYVGGGFTTIGSESRAGVAALDITTGSSTAWNPGTTGFSAPEVISLYGSTLYIGGGFSSIAGSSHPNFAQFGPITIQFSTNSDSQSESETSTFLVVGITSSNTSTHDITFDYEATGGTATGGGTDYTLAAGTGTITAGNTTTSIALTIVDDSTDESDETVVVTLSNPAFADLGTIDTFTYTIEDDDEPAAGVSVSAISGNTTEGGVTSTFTVVLDSVPTDDVVVSVASSDTGEGVINTSTLTFTPTTWDTAQTVTVTGVDDDIDDGDIGYTITLGAAVSDDTNYNGLNPNDVSVTNEDDDTAGVTVSAISGDTSEAGTTATFTVVLDSEPTDDVTIDISSSDATEGTVGTDTLTFTTANWDSAQTVTVTGVDDDVDDGDTAYTITLAAATSNDVGYSGLNPNDVSVTNTDDDTAGFTISAISGNTTEGGVTSTFTIVFNSEPTDDVTIGVTSSDTTEGSPSTNTLTFTAANWDTVQTVIVTGQNDDIDDGNIAYTITLGAASSNDTSYDGLNPNDVSVTNTDDDTAGITVSAISGNTSEAGATSTFTVVLDSEPTNDVTIGVTSSDTTEGSPSTNTLTFTAANWDTVQTVIVTGVDDDVDDGDVAYVIVLAAATSNDNNYDGINPADVNVTNTDDDTAGITVTESGGSTAVTEAGGTDSYTIVLDSEPTEPVTVSITDDADVSVSTSSVVFTSANWDTAVTVTVSAVDDDLDEVLSHSGVITHAVSSDDTDYDAFVIEDITATVTDDDTAGITVTESGGSTAVTEAGGTDSYTIVLDSEPTANVTVTIAASGSQVVVSTSSIIFTSASWDTPVTVTVSAVNDDIDESSPHADTVTHTVASGDAAYNDFEVGDIAVAVTDDDTAGVTVSAISGNTTEAGGTATFTVVLNSEPTDGVTIGVSTSDATEGTVSGNTLTFTSANWDTAQTVIVTGVDDDIDDGNIAYTITLGAATSNDSNYNGLNPSDVNVTNVDNDTAGVTLAETGGTTETTEAGSTDTYTLVLDSEPVDDVTVAISGDADIQVSTTSIVFTSANWDTAVTVTVSAVDDDLDEASPHTGTITHTVTSDDTDYDGIEVADVTAAITDDDTAGVTVSAISGNTTEAGGTATFTVVLGSQPTDTVIIGVTSSDTTEGTASTSSLSFTSANWDTAQTVTVTGVDDDLGDGNQTYSVVLGAAVSNDSNYDTLDPDNVSVTNTDNDTPGVTVTQSGGSTAVTEAGGTDTYTVVLNTEPTATVTITVTPDTQTTVSASTVVFTTDNWDTEQTVTVSAVDDQAVEESHTSSITHTAVSEDGNYNNIAIGSVTVTITDNDTSGGGFIAVPTPVVTEPSPPTPRSEGQAIALPEGERVPVTIGGQSHTFSAISATSDEVTVQIESDPIVVTVKKGEFRDVDSNRDGTVDVRVAYRGLRNGTPEVVVAELVQEQKEIFINDNARETITRQVRVRINVDNAQSFVLSNTSDFSDKTFRPFVAETEWELTEGFGEKIVYARLLLTGGAIVTVSDSISYTQTIADIGECALTPGKAYKKADHPGVYYVTASCTKRPFQHSRVFFTYFGSFSEVMTVDASLLAQVPDDALGFMPFGPKVTLLSGSLVKTVSQPAVYLLLQDETRHIATETVFNALRLSWKWVEDVAEEVLAKFRTGKVIDQPVRPAKTLIQYIGSPDIYILEAAMENPGVLRKRKIQRFEDIAKLGYRADTIVVVSDAEQYPDGPDMVVE